MSDYMDFLETINELMNMGMDESEACREAYELMYPEDYE